MPRQDPLRIGHLSTVYHTAYVLRGTGLLGDRGISASWKLYPSGPDIVAAMRDGHVDAGYIGLPPVIIGIDRGIPLRCIAGGHIEGTVIVAGQDIRTLAECQGMAEFLSQFAGKAIGTPPMGSIHDVIVRDLLSTYSHVDIRPVNYPWADFLPAALQDGEIAAAAGTPALAVAAARYASARIAVPPHRLWPWNPSYGIVVMEQLLHDEDLLTGFIEAHEEACERIRRDPAGCAATVADATGFVDAKFVLGAYRISPKYCASLPPEYLASTAKFAKTLLPLGYVSREVLTDEIFVTSLVKRIHREPPHYNAGIRQA
jgi:NitT/TauT family transport system substrate-binding protein